MNTRSDTERVSNVVFLLAASHSQKSLRWTHKLESIWKQIQIWANYALMVLDTGHFARGFHLRKEGDIVALLAGCEFPIAIRPDGNGNYRFVAPLYVDGIMYGEAVSISLGNFLLSRLIQRQRLSSWSNICKFAHHSHIT
ncbi:hypothetical protein F5Y03DRAFT_365124 [Xylaria venustula]|nr:hypothetical protein F5Y03DRAFT_365124 [Xylaria venustula]